ncbi:hypothetical protein PT283_05030 [Acetobacteraceae bacterium ESL0697]|nr:hypothetical protein [Acetobacteraceae bacterium ESL0697]
MNRSELKKESTDQNQEVDSYEESIKQAKKTTQLEECKEQHKHDEEMLKKKLGWIGRFIGGHDCAPMTIAFLVVATGMVVIAISALFDGIWPSHTMVWTKIIDSMVTLISSSLAYVFGRYGGRNE